MPQSPQASPTAPVRVTFVTPDSPETYQVEIDGALTGQAAIRGLVDHAGLVPPSSQLSYGLKLKRTSAELPLDRPLLESGVQSGDIIVVVRSDMGAGRA